MAEEALLLLGWSNEGEPQGPCFPDTGPLWACECHLWSSVLAHNEGWWEGDS